MIQQTLTLTDTAPTAPNWDAQLNSVLHSFRLALRRFRLSIDTAGDEATPSVFSIQLVDASENNLAESVNVRVRLCAGSSFIRGSSAVISSVITGTTLITYFSDDLLLKTDASGLLQIEVTDSAIEKYSLRLGKPELLPPLADFRSFVLFDNKITALYLKNTAEHIIYNSSEIPLQHG